MSGNVIWTRLKRIVLLAEAGIFIAVSSMAKRIVRFDFIAKYLGTVVLVPNTPELSENTLRDLRWTFSVWQRRWFWPPVCLTEVLALRLMLDRRGLAAAVYFGVRRGANGPVDAHAWMMCGTQILPRRQDVSAYGVLSIFQR